MNDINVIYSKAFSEVLFVINSLTPELYNMIPESFIKLLKENKDESYVITKDYINKNGMLPETKAILSLIYRDFFQTDSERKKLIEQDKNELKQEDEKYLNVFKNTKLESQNDEQTVGVEEDKQLAVIESEKWYYRIFRKIKNLFKKKYF